MHKVCNLIENIQKVFLFFALHYCTKAYLVFTAEKHFFFICQATTEVAFSFLFC